MKKMVYRQQWIPFLIMKMKSAELQREHLTLQ